MVAWIKTMMVDWGRVELISGTAGLLVAGKWQRVG
jgi:hypothetical protein